MRPCEWFQCWRSPESTTDPEPLFSSLSVFFFVLLPCRRNWNMAFSLEFHPNKKLKSTYLNVLVQKCYFGPFFSPFQFLNWDGLWNCTQTRFPAVIFGCIWEVRLNIRFSFRNSDDCKIRVWIPAFICPSFIGIFWVKVLMGAQIDKCYFSEWFYPHMVAAACSLPPGY